MISKKIFKIISILLIVLLSSSFIVGCGAEDTSIEEEQQVEEAQQIKVGFLVKTLGNVYWQKMQQGALDAGWDLGVNVVVRDVATEADIQAQTDLAMTMLNEGYDAIVASSITSTNLIPAIAEANKLGVPWISVVEPQDEETLKAMDAELTAKIFIDYYDEGRLQAEWIVDALNGEGKIAIVEGLPGSGFSRGRTESVREVADKYPGIEVVASQPADWMRDIARNVAADMITAHPDINAILANNDTMALGVVAAVNEAGRTGDILVAGIDAIAPALEAIVNGEMAATVDGLPYLVGYFGVCAAVKAHLEGTDTVDDLILPPSVWDSSNVEEVLATDPKPPAYVMDGINNPYLPIRGITLR